MRGVSTLTGEAVLSHTWDTWSPERRWSRTALHVGLTEAPSFVRFWHTVVFLHLVKGIYRYYLELTNLTFTEFEPWLQRTPAERPQITRIASTREKSVKTVAVASENLTIL